MPPHPTRSRIFKWLAVVALAACGLTLLVVLTDQWYAGQLQVTLQRRVEKIRKEELACAPIRSAEFTIDPSISGDLVALWEYRNQLDDHGSVAEMLWVFQHNVETALDDSILRQWMDHNPDLQRHLKHLLHPDSQWIPSTGSEPGAKEYPAHEMMEYAVFQLLLAAKISFETGDARQTQEYWLAAWKLAMQLDLDENIRLILVIKRRFWNSMDHINVDGVLRLWTPDRWENNRMATIESVAFDFMTSEANFQPSSQLPSLEWPKPFEIYDPLPYLQSRFKQKKRYFYERSSTCVQDRARAVEFSMDCVRYIRSRPYWERAVNAQTPQQFSCNSERIYYPHGNLRARNDPASWYYAELSDSEQIAVRQDCLFGMFRMALLLKQFKMRHGEYPDRLDALGENCQDPCTGKAFEYSRKEEGFRLYSPGPDLKVEAADPDILTNWRQDGPSDDLAWIVDH